MAGGPVAPEPIVALERALGVVLGAVGRVQELAAWRGLRVTSRSPGGWRRRGRSATRTPSWALTRWCGSARGWPATGRSASRTHLAAAVSAGCGSASAADTAVRTPGPHHGSTWLQRTVGGGWVHCRPGLRGRSAAGDRHVPVLLRAAAVSAADTAVRTSGRTRRLRQGAGQRSRRRRLRRPPTGHGSRRQASGRPTGRTRGQRM